MPPWKLAPAIPPALDSLILSLLSIDPLTRPSSAAAVSDRLNVLADLPAEDELAAESSGRRSASERSHTSRVTDVADLKALALLDPAVFACGAHLQKSTMPEVNGLAFNGTQIDLHNAFS